MDLVAEFRRVLKQSTLTSALDGRSFVRFSSVAEWLTTIASQDTPHTRRIDDIYSNLQSRRKNLPSSPVQHSRIRVKLFCILFSIGCLEMLDMISPYTLLEEDLPLSLDKLHDIALKDTSNRFKPFINTFFEAQRSFCPAIFDLSKDNIVASDLVIPISAMRMIGAGRTACIYQVAVPQEFLGPHLADKLTFGRPADIEDVAGPSVQLVLKTYKENMSDIGCNEARVYQLLKGNENFIHYICTFNYAGRVNILLEKGHQDLEEYFATQPPPVLHREVSEFWYALSSIVECIGDIHEIGIEIANGRGKSSVVEHSGWHGDIKLSNILRVRDRWKLIDFGFTSLTIGSEEAIAPRRQPLSYAPPGAETAKTHLSKSFMQSADIWSLGCVFSIAATWVVLGNEGIAKYTAYRIKASHEVCSRSGSTSLSGDFFHDHSKVLHAVTQWHEFLRDHLRKSDSITEKVLDMIDELMFVNREHRCGAKAIRRRLIECCNEYNAGKDRPSRCSEWGNILDGLEWKEYKLPRKEED